MSKQTSTQEVTISDVIRHRVAAVQEAEQCWSVEPRVPEEPLPGFFRRRLQALARWLVKDIVEQQNAFNASLVRVLHRISNESDYRQQLLNRLGHTIEGVIENQENLTDELRQYQDELQGLRGDVWRLRTELRENIKQLQQALELGDQRETTRVTQLAADIEQVNLTLSEAIQQANQVAQQANQVAQQTNQAVHQTNHAFQQSYQTLNHALDEMRLSLSDLELAQTALAEQLALNYSTVEYKS